MLAAIAFLVAANSTPFEPGEIEAKKVRFVNGKAGFQGLEWTPPGKGPHPAIVVVHGDFGLTPWVQKQCARLAAKGYHVLALDLYRGEIAKDVEEAHILDRGLEEEKVRAQLKLAADRLARMPNVRGDALAILGWDMGGGYALDMATREPRYKAVINCYGRLSTDSKEFARLDAAVLCLLAGKSAGTPKETIDQFQAALKKAGKQADVHIFANSPVGFMDPANPYGDGKADEAVIADAWRRIDAHLEKTLRSK